MNPGFARELERIIDKCLENDRDLRYQHASEIRADLQRLKRDTDSGRPHATACIARPECLANAWKVLVPGRGGAGASWPQVTSTFIAPPKLTDKDTIVLADFNNTTGDPVFDGRFVKGWRYNWNSRLSLRSVSDERIQQTLGLMGQPADARLTPEIARQVCQREPWKRRRAGGLDRKPRNPVRVGFARQELPHWRRTGRGAGAGQQRKKTC